MVPSPIGSFPLPEFEGAVVVYACVVGMKISIPGFPSRKAPGADDPTTPAGFQLGDSLLQLRGGGIAGGQKCIERGRIGMAAREVDHRIKPQCEQRFGFIEFEVDLAQNVPVSVRC